MPLTLTINGTEYEYPQTGENLWGTQATAWANGVTSGMLQKAGGSFTLTAEVDFGATYGLRTAYYESQSASPSGSGQIRLGNTETISWRNAADGADLPFSVNASDNLEFNSIEIAVAPIPFSDMEVLTTDRALQTSSGGVAEVSAVTATELGYVNGVTSALQTQLDAKLSLSGGTMSGILTLSGSPSGSLDAATKAYVDAAGAGLVYKEQVVVATAAAGTLATDFDNGKTVDGVVVATGNRILIKDQAAPAENGVYTVAASGAPTRATDSDTWTELISAFYFVTSGTANESTNWVCTVVAGGTIDVTAVTFVQQSAPGTYTADGQGLELAATEFSLELDGATLTKGASGVKVGDTAINNAQIGAAAAIAVTKLAAVTASRALASDGSGFITPATTTATELDYVNGVTSAIQTQMDAKVALAGDTMTGDLVLAGDPDAALKAATKQYVDATSPVIFAANEIHLDGGNGWGSTGTKTRRFSNIRKNTGSNLTLAQSAANGDSVTVNADGVYSVYVSEYGNSAGRFFGVTIDTSSTSTSIVSLSYANGRRNISFAESTIPNAITIMLSLSSGNVIRFQGDGGATSTSAAVAFQVCQCEEF